MVVSANAEPEALIPIASKKTIILDLLGLAVFGMIAVIAVLQTATLNLEAAVFPKTIAIAMLCLVAFAVANLFFSHRACKLRTNKRLYYPYGTGTVLHDDCHFAYVVY